MSAPAVERWPAFARAWAAAGNEIAGHAYAQDTRMHALNVEEERANIQRCVEVIESVTGVRPVGWKLGYGTPGQGSMPHLAAMFLFSTLAKVELLHVPYNGAAPAITATIAGQPQLSVVTLPPAVPLVKAGRLKAIAVTSAKRTGALPDVPTVAESAFPGYEVNMFSGFFVPRGTPASAIERLRATVLNVLAMPDIQVQPATLGFEPADNASEDFRMRIADEIRKWNKVLAGVKVD